uniref:Uncharacterized protein n=1 Tax=Tanacetum cinerariifolium TaxID=118510 RepID=A0A6L2MYB6_TANCI|nr:hypothetical protein [Tanacetum cinerariifolium]
MNCGGIYGGDGVLKAKSSGVLGDRVVVMSMGDELSLEFIEDDDVPIVDGVLEGALGAFGDGGCCVDEGIYHHLR